MVEADGKEMKGVEDVRLGKPMFFNPEYDPLDTAIAYVEAPLTALTPQQQLHFAKHLLGCSGDSVHAPFLFSKFISYLSSAIGVACSEKPVSSSHYSITTS